MFPFLTTFHENKKKKQNKHIEEGYRTTKLRLSFWNDKQSHNEKAISVRDRLGAILSHRDIDLMGITEANVFKDDDSSEVKIKGYNIRQFSGIRKGLLSHLYKK